MRISASRVPHSQLGPIRGLLLTLLLSCAFAACNQASLRPPRQIVGEATTLEQDGYFRESREHLRRAYTETHDISLLMVWLDMDMKVLADLKCHNTRTGVTPYQTPSYWSSAASALGVSTLSGLGSYASTGVLVVTDQQRRRVLACERAHPVPIGNEDESKVVLSQYELRKFSLLLCKRTVAEAVLMVPSSERTELVRLGDAVDSALTGCAKDRCRYLSFDVLSPRFARAEQLIFISQHENLFGWGHSKETLLEAAKMMGGSVDEPQEADESVRNQFLNVFRQMRDTAGSAEFDDLKTTVGLLKGDNLGSGRWLVK